jgi:hypothetical protein
VCDVAAVVCSSTGCSHAGPAERRARRHAPTAHATMTSTGRSSPRTMRDLQTPPGGGGMRAQERSAYARLWPTTNTRTRAHTHTHIHMHTHTHTRWQHCDQQHLPHARQPAAALMPALAAPARTHPHSLEQRAEVVHVSEAAAVALPVGKGEHLCGVAAHTAAWGGGGGPAKARPPHTHPPRPPPPPPPPAPRPPPPPPAAGGGPPPAQRQVSHMHTRSAHASLSRVHQDTATRATQAWSSPPPCAGTQPATHACVRSAAAPTPPARVARVQTRGTLQQDRGAAASTRARSCPRRPSPCAATACCPPCQRPTLCAPRSAACARASPCVSPAMTQHARRRGCTPQQRTRGTLLVAQPGTQRSAGTLSRSSSSQRPHRTSCAGLRL